MGTELQGYWVRRKATTCSGLRGKQVITRTTTNKTLAADLLVYDGFQLANPCWLEPFWGRWSQNTWKLWEWSNRSYVPVSLASEVLSDAGFVPFAGYPLTQKVSN
jgi:hypothetical protein